MSLKSDLDLVDQDDDTPDPADLLAWFTQNGGHLHPAIDLQYHPRAGFHLRARHALHGPFEAVTCPLHLSLSHYNLAPPDADIPPHVIPRLSSPLSTLWGKLPPTVLTCLLLIEQLLQEERSPWYAYIAALPDVEPLVATVYSKSHKYVESTVIPTARDRRRSKVDKNWELARLALKQAGLKNTELYNECDKATFRWAEAILSSRAFASSYCFPSLESFQMLFPVFDLANHSPTARVRWTVGDDAFRLSCLDHVEKGEQVYNNYGPKSNAELLLGYGFAIRNNPVDQVPIPILTERNDAYLRHVPFGMDPQTVYNTDGGLRLENNLLGRYNNQVACLRGIPPHVVFACYIVTLKARRLEPHDVDHLHVPGRIVLGTIVNLWRLFLNDFVPMHNPHGNVTDFDTELDEHQWIYMAGQVEICQGIRREILHRIQSLQRGAYATVSRPCRPMITDISTVLSICDGSPDTAYAIAVRELLTECVGFDAGTGGNAPLVGVQKERIPWVFFILAIHAYARVGAMGEGEEDREAIQWARDLEVVYPFSVERYRALPTETEETDDGCTRRVGDGDIRDLLLIVNRGIERRPLWSHLLGSFSAEEMEAALVRACHIAQCEAIIRSLGCHGTEGGRLCMYLNQRPETYDPAAGAVEAWVTEELGGEEWLDTEYIPPDYEPFTS